MSRRRKLHEASVKARVALEAVKERQTVAEIAKHFGVHPTQVNPWKRKLLEEVPARRDSIARTARGEARRSRRRSCTSKSADSRWSWTG